MELQSLVMGKEKKSYTDLEVWKEARILSKEIYLASAAFPSDERFGLTGHIRRAAISVASNIAKVVDVITRKIVFNFSSLPEVLFMKLRHNCIFPTI